MSVIESLFNIFAVHECVSCRAEGSLLCAACAGHLPRIVPRCYRCRKWSDDFTTCHACRKHTPLDRVRTLVAYEGSAKALLKRLKFERARAGAETIAELLAASLTTADTLITYVPTAASRVRERGYDQSALIARALARRLGAPCLPLLGRLGGARQLGQQRSVRQAQMQNSFRPLRTDLIHNQTILLVDDVLTTGATCEAAARVLRRAGARRVEALVFAVA